MIRLINKLYKLINIRKKLQCSVCDSTVEDFIPLPSSFKDNSKRYGFKYFGKGETINLLKYSCPICGASDRERLYANYFKEKFNKSWKAKLIHFAPEAALKKFLQKYFNNIEYITADIADGDYDIKCDLTNLNILADNSFDFFICSHVLEHVENDKKAMSELKRILKPGGKGILMAPVHLAIKKTIENIPDVRSDEDRWKYYGQYDHVRLYAKKDYIKRIKDVGFIIKELNINFFGAEVFRTLGLSKTSTLYIVEK
jgi:SAM-dependent methyltransferase